jgi:hypothetical protein
MLEASPHKRPSRCPPSLTPPPLLFLLSCPQEEEEEEEDEWEEEGETGDKVGEVNDALLPPLLLLAARALAPGLLAAQVAGMSLRARAQRKQRSATDKPTRPNIVVVGPPPLPLLTNPLVVEDEGNEEVEDGLGWWFKWGDAAAAQDAALTSAPLHSTITLSGSTLGPSTRIASRAQSEGPPNEDTNSASSSSSSSDSPFLLLDFVVTSFFFFFFCRAAAAFTFAFTFAFSAGDGSWVGGGGSAVRP